MEKGKYEIRAATLEDALEISVLINRSIDSIAHKGYTQEQLVAWKNDNSVDAIKTKFSDRLIYCAFDDKGLLGTISLKENEILALHVQACTRKSGIGARLVKHVESYARAKGVKEISLTSVPSAVPFYLKQGYQKVRELIVYLEGVSYEESEMSKQL